MEEVIIYTDGACSGNPGPGGWGTILMYKDKKKRNFWWLKKYYQQCNGTNSCNRGIKASKISM